MFAGTASRWLPRGWSVLLALLLLGPALGRGVVLSYDMVWVPDLAFRTDFLGLGSGLPRAVPSDAVVAVVDEVVPGALLQKLVLVGSLVLGGLGAARLAPVDSLVGRLVAVSVYQWNPFVVERLLLGHWPVLLCYAVLPWVLADAREVRRSGRLPGRLLWTVVLGSLSASAGLMTGLTLVAFAVRRGARRANLLVLGVVTAVNAPWLVAGLIHVADATSAEAGARVFALQDVGDLPGPLAALGLGGVWNSEVLLPSRTGVQGLVALAALLVLVVAGTRSWWLAVGRRDAVAFLVCWSVGWGVAVLTWAAPGSMGALVSAVPGAGLVRDGSRMLALCAPLVAATAGHGAALLVRRLPSVPARVGAGMALLLLPVAVLPDAAFGLSGRLGAVGYPGSWSELRTVVQDVHGPDGGGDLLVLPFTSYRAPAWNDGHKVLDPLGRYLTPNYVAGDDLFVSGTRVRGEDPRAREVAAALAEPDPQARAEGLAAAGIGLAVADRTVPGGSPDLAGDRVAAPADFQVTKISSPAERGVSSTEAWAIALAWLAFALTVLLGVGTTARESGRRAVFRPGGG